MSQLVVELPAEFDVSRHASALSRWIASNHGDGWEVDRIDEVNKVVYASRTQQVAISGASPDQTGGRFQLALAKGTKMSDAPKAIAKLEAQWEGFSVVVFDPHRGYTELAKLDAATLRCREAVATAVGAKTFEVQASPREDGGFTVQLPAKYTPSKHDGKLQEVASDVVGKFGWRWHSDPAALTGEVIPGEPATFPPSVPYPHDTPVNPDRWAHIPLGVGLPESGEGTGPTVTTDFAASAHMQLSGTQGSGKSVTLAALIYGALARGWELAIIDPIKEGTDFVDFQPFVVDSGWGCESVPEALTALELSYAEGQRRKQLVKQHRVRKWTELPADLGVRPRLVVCDEITSLFAMEKVPKLPKDNPLLLEIEERNLWKATIQSTIGKVARELRYVGVCLVASSQVSSRDTGVSTELRTQLGQKFLMGGKTTDGNRKLALTDPDAVPTVPSHVAEDARAVQGVGVAEIAGSPPCVFKGFWVDPARLAAMLEGAGVAQADRPRPTQAEIAANVPTLS